MRTVTRLLARVLPLFLAIGFLPTVAAMEPLTERAGDPERGRAAVLDRERGHCLLCHRIDQLDEDFQGNIGPPLSRVGERLTAAELRARLVDPTRLNPATVMPAYHRIEGLRQVAEAYRGEPILTAQEVEDVVAFLETLVLRRGDGPDAVLATGSSESERGEPDKGESDRGESLRGESGRREPGSSESARKETVSNASGRRVT